MKTLKKIIVTIAVVVAALFWLRNYLMPGADTVKEEFLAHQEKIDELVKAFDNGSTIRLVDIGWFGTFDVAAVKGEVIRSDKKVKREYEDYDRIEYATTFGGAIDGFLQGRGVSREAFEMIVLLMKQLDIDDIVLVDYMSVPYIEIKYPSRNAVCAWFWQTPLKGYDINQLAKTVFVDERDGDEGPYIVNNRWLTYRSCPL